LNNYGAGFLFLATASQEAHSWSTRAIEMVLPGAKRQARMFKLFRARSFLLPPPLKRVAKPFTTKIYNMVNRSNN
jgi:hypothetical protein